MTHPINGDQVAWMLGAIRRYLPPTNAPSVSRARDVQAYGLLYELMEVAGLHFEDEAAARNGTPGDVFMLRKKDVDPIGAAAGRQVLRSMVDGGMDCASQNGAIGRP